jgi:hypothetical protein
MPTDLSKEPVDVLHQIVRLVLPNTPMHRAASREIDRRTKKRMRAKAIANSSILILGTLTLIAAWVTL